MPKITTGIYIDQLDTYVGSNFCSCNLAISQFTAVIVVNGPFMSALLLDGMWLAQL